MSDLIEDFKDLRERRLVAKKSVREIAREAGVNPSLISHIEAGRRALTDDIRAAYYNVLSPSDTPRETSHSRNARYAIQVINLIRSNWPIDRQLLERTKRRPGKSEHHGESDLDDFCNRVQSLARKPGGLDSSDSATFVWTDLGEYLNSFIKHRFTHVTRLFLEADAKFTLLFSAAVEDDVYRDQMKWLIKQKLRYLNHRKTFSFDTVKELDFRHFPIDFFLIQNKLANIRFSSGEYSRRNGTLIDGDSANGRNGLRAISGYLERIDAYREDRIQAFFGQEDLISFLDAYLASENASGARNLAQTFIGSHTRPLLHIKPGSNWWNRYREILGDDEKVQKLAENRRRAHSALRTRMTHSPVRQICSRQELNLWAEGSGRRSVFDPAQIRENASDKLSQIDYIIELLKKEDKFEIAVIDQSKGKDLGWNNNLEKQQVNWLTQGKDTLLIESYTEKRHRDNPGPGHTEFQFVIKDPVLTSAFVHHYDSCWAKLAGDRTQKRNSIAFFQQLKTRIA